MRWEPKEKNMKKITIALSLLLTLTMLMSITVSAADFYAGVLDNPNFQQNTDGIKYVEKTSKQTGYTQKIYYGEYNTTSEDAKYEWVIHSVKTNDTSTTLTNVLNIAKDYEKTTGRKVMLAINGDYFYNTGSNVDTYVNNGIVYSQGNMANKNCLGFDNEGKVVIGRMTETTDCVVLYDANGNPVFYPISGYNRQPAAGEIIVYNAPGEYTVSNAGACVISTDSANLTQYPLRAVDKTMTKIREVQSSISFKLNSGQLAVVYTEKHADDFSANKYNRTAVDLVNIPAGNYEGCTWIIGGYDKLVDNGVVNKNCHTDNDGNGDAPRTFIGFKEDGTGFVCVVDGRQASTGGYGITVNQEAVLADVLGAKYALELDGGGSSTMIVRINDTLVCRNSPSDGSMRKVSNAILLVEKAEEPTVEPENPGETPVDPENPGETPVEPENPGDNTENPDDNPDIPEETPGKPEDENPGEVQGGNNQGNTSSGNAFVDFILSIIEAIKKFFMNLFS